MSKNLLFATAAVLFFNTAVEAQPNRRTLNIINENTIEVIEGNVHYVYPPRSLHKPVGCFQAWFPWSMEAQRSNCS